MAKSFSSNLSEFFSLDGRWAYSRIAMLPEVLQRGLLTVSRNVGMAKNIFKLRPVLFTKVDHFSHQLHQPLIENLSNFYYTFFDLFLVKTHICLFVTKLGRSSRHDFHTSHSQTKNIVSLFQRWTLSHEPMPDFIHLKRAYESILTQKHLFIGRNSLPNERVIDKLPCGTFFADHFRANVTMTCFEWSLNQENESLTYCKNDMFDLMLFER